jgi:hypothetical protein
MRMTDFEAHARADLAPTIPSALTRARVDELLEGLLAQREREGSARP